MTEKRQERINKHRATMPRRYRATYDKAMSGKSLRAAVNSFCLECVGWQREEVKKCCSPQCSLFPYRPVHGISGRIDGARKRKPESNNTDEGDTYVE